MKKKVCKNCRSFVEEGECPVCKSNQFATSYQGRITFLDAEKSQIAKKINVTQKGEYAIKVR